MVLALPPGLEGLSSGSPVDLREEARRAAQRYGINPALFERQIDQESGFNPQARNAVSGARGIAQFMDATAREMGVDPNDPIAALDAGARYVRQNQDYHGGDERAAFASYNAGPGTIDKLKQQYGDAWEAHLPDETKQYLSAIYGDGGGALAQHLSTGQTSFQNRIRPPSAGDSGLVFQPRGPLAEDEPTQPDNLLARLRRRSGDPGIYNVPADMAGNTGRDPGLYNVPEGLRGNGGRDPGIYRDPGDLTAGERITQAVQTAGNPLSRGFMGTGWGGDTTPPVDGNYGDVPYDAGQGQPGSGGPLTARIGRPVGGFRTSETIPDPNATTDNPLVLAGRAYNAVNPRIPVVTPALEQVQDALATPLGRMVAGPLASGAVPTRGADIALTVAPFVGEAGDALRGARGAAEGLATRGLEGEVARAPGAAAAVDERLLARWKLSPSGGAMTPAEMYQKAIAQGMTEDDIKALLGPEVGQAAIDAGRGGVDTEAQREATRLTGNDAASHAAKRVYNNTIDAGGSLDEASQAAKQAAAQATEGIQGQVKPNVLADEATASDMATAMSRARTGTVDQGERLGSSGPGTVGPITPRVSYPDNWTIDDINRYRKLEQGLNPRGEGFIPPSDNPTAAQLNFAEQAPQLGFGEAGAPYEGPAPPEGASLSTQRLNRGLTEPTFQGEGVARDTSAGLFPGPLLEAGPTSGKFAAVSMESPEARTALLRSKFDQPTYQGEGASLPPPRNPTVNSQGGFPEFAPKPGQAESLVHRAYREVVSLINAPISLVTYGHEPIFRQGIGFALSHPSTAREALGNLASVARNPEAVAAINEGLNAKPFVKAALESGWLHEGERPLETFVNRVINKIPGMQNSRESARIYLTTLRKAGYEQEAQRLFQAGVTDSAEYKALWDTISDVTGHGLRGKSLAVGGINPVFSPQAMLGRFRGLFDPIAPELGNLKAGGAPNLVGAGARNVAIKNLLAIGGMAISVEGIAKAAGLDLKWHLLNTPLGKVEVGPSSIDPTAGYGSIIRLGARAVDAAQSGDFGRMRDAVANFVNGQLGPVAGTAWATLSGQDWQGKDFNLIKEITSDPTKSGSLARQLMVPIAANAIWDAVKANGPLGALIAAPSLGAMGVETNLLQDARDKATERLAPQAKAQGETMLGPDYASAGPILKSLVDNDQGVIEAKGSPSPYQQRKAEVVTPIDNEQKQYEAAFTHNLLSRPLRDWYHDTSTKRQQAAQDLSGQFAQQFAGFDKTKYDTALRGYFDLAVKNPDGSLDFDATESARQDYFAKLPADQKQWIDESLQVSRDKQTPLKQKYLDYIDAKKQAGYFAIKSDDKDATKKRAALDVAHPELDALAWYFGGGQGTKSGGSLNSTAAVQQALKLAPERPVKFAGMERAVNENEGTLAAWQQYGERAAKYLSGFQVERDKERISGFLYQKKWDDLSSNQQASVTSHIKNGVMDASPDLEAYLAWTGQRDTVSNEALKTLRELRTKYGRETGRDAKNPIRIR